MFVNYLKIAFRNFRHNKIFSFINIVGLAIGISASLVIYLIVSYDFNFDKFENDGGRIYRVVSDMKFPDKDFKNSGVPLPLIYAAEKQITGVELFAPFSTANSSNVIINKPGLNKPDIYRRQNNIVYADNNYFKLLQYKWLAGSAQNALSNPYTTVLTESRAKTYFPDEDVLKDIGKTITYNDTITTTVTGIVKDLDEVTDFTFKEFISYKTLPQNQFTDERNWGGISSSDQFFIKLNASTNAALIIKQIQQLFNKHQDKAYLKNVLSLQPLSDIHFNNNYDNFDQRLADRPTLYGLMVVAAILLLLACINFINLTTAQAVQRAKEIGIRKTMGSSKYQLIIQFLSETFFLTLLATILALIFIPFLLKIFSGFIPPAIKFDMMLRPHVIIFIIVLIIAVTILSGFYPSLILSAYKPVSVLKNQAFSNASTTRSGWIRKFLTVTQFILAQAFVIATIIVGKQIHYSLGKDLGFKRDGIITISTPWNNKDVSKREVLLQTIQALPQVEKAALAGSPPTVSGSSMQTMKFFNGKKEIETTVEVKDADSAYFNLYKMKLVAGRYLLPADSATEYLINENYARFLGFKNPADAVGKMLGGSGSTTPIVGVLRDFYFRSLHEPIKPLVYYAGTPNYSTLHILLKPDVNGNVWKTAIDKIEKLYKQIYPDEEFKYSFIDDNIAKFYVSEQNTLSLLRWASGLAIFISCLGLLGLVIYTTNQRTKEIGVRKVLGASVSQIVTLISRDFIKLVLLAFIIAAPIAWMGMNKWLQSFAYRTNISWWIFLASGAFMVLIALFTLSIQTIRAAGANPVKSLRTE